MKTTIWAATITGAMLLAGAGTAQARIVYETYTGTISDGQDPNGRFGAPTANLTGKTLKIAFRFDLGAGGIVDSDGSTSSHYYGGSRYGTPSICSTEVSIEGAKRRFRSSYSGDTYRWENIPDAGGSVLSELGAQCFDANDQGDFAEALFASSADFLGSFELGNHVDFTGDHLMDGGSYVFFAGDNFGFAAGVSGLARVTVTSSATGVPEPAALALFGLGAGLIAAVRMRRG